MWRKKQTKSDINLILFRSYMLAMFAVLLVVTIIFAAFGFSSMIRNVRSSIAQSNHAVAISVDNQIKQMDTISISALYSNLLKDSFSTYSAFLNTSESTMKNPMTKVSNAKVLHDLMFAIIGVNNDIKQINLYNIDFGGFGTGLYNGYINRSLTLMPWYEQTHEAQGKRYVTQAYLSDFFPLSKFKNSDREFISLCRMYFDQFNRMDGAIEVVEYYNTVFDAANNVDSAYKPRYFIYDTNGTRLFPRDDTDDVFDYFNYHTSIKDTQSVNLLRNSVTNKDEFIIFETMPYSDFLSVAVVDSINFYTPIIQYFFLVIALFILGVIICYATARRLAMQLTTPLTTMHAYLSKIDIERMDWKKLDMEKTGIVEIDDLSKSIDMFQAKLKTSMDEILLLQRHEAQSQMLALQSQMNPHFLYNSISTINAMAEEGMTKEISQMSDAISSILRYVSSNRESTVRLELELENVDLYLECHKLRYGDNLVYNIEVNDDMLDIMVPKLCIQLLVENAIKYTTTSVSPPFKILVQCLKSEGKWIVSVYDNGSGFSEDVIASTTKKTKDIDKSGLLPTLELDGMGLMNLYIRLRLIYKENCIFEIGNRDCGGAFVRIGGIIDG